MAASAIGWVILHTDLYWRKFGQVLPHLVEGFRATRQDGRQLLGAVPFRDLVRSTAAKLVKVDLHANGYLSLRRGGAGPDQLLAQAGLEALVD